MTTKTEGALRSMNDTARQIGVTVRTIYRLLHAGDLRAVKVGSRTFFRQAEIDRYLSSLPSWKGEAA